MQTNPKQPVMFITTFDSIIIIIINIMAHPIFKINYFNTTAQIHPKHSSINYYNLFYSNHQHFKVNFKQNFNSEFYLNSFNFTE